MKMKNKFNYQSTPNKGSSAFMTEDHPIHHLQWMLCIFFLSINLNLGTVHASEVHFEDFYIVTPEERESTPLDELVDYILDGAPLPPLQTIDNTTFSYKFVHNVAYLVFWGLCWDIAERTSRGVTDPLNLIRKFLLTLSTRRNPVSSTSRIHSHLRTKVVFSLQKLHDPQTNEVRYSFSVEFLSQLN